MELSSKSESEDSNKLEESGDRRDDVKSKSKHKEKNDNDSDAADIQTGADTLLSFLEEKTKFPVTEISEDLGVPKKTVKIWGKALEEAGYVEISYSALKGMVLEYDSNKSYEELNVGRSELPSDIDEIEVEVEGELVKNVEGEVKETFHHENKNKEEEEDSEEEVQEKEDEKNYTGNQTRSNQKSEETTNSRSNKEEDSSLTEDKGENEEKNKDENDLEDDNSLQEGKEKLKQELKKLNNEKARDYEDSAETRRTKNKQRVRAKKAKLNMRKEANRKNSSEGQSGNEQNPSTGDSSNHKNIQQVRKRNSGPIHLVNTFNNHGEKLLKLDRSIRDPELDNDKVFDEINRELEGLKEYIVRNNLDYDDKIAVRQVLSILENTIDEAESKEGKTSFIRNIIDKFS